MEPFDPGMFPHRVFLLPLAEDTDTDAGVTEAFPAPGSELLCRIRLKGSRSGMSGDSEVAVTLADVAFPHDPGCKKGDRFQKQSSATMLRALAAAQARDADNVLFVVSCEVIE